MNISATIITLNEEKNIAACLESVSFVDEIVVVDSGSTDATESICRSHPKVRFIHQEWLGFGRQKNRAAELASYEWILNVDADERVSERLATAIRNADFHRYAGFRMARENYFGGRWIRHCGWYPDYNLRLYDRRVAGFSDRSVHEAVRCDGEVGVLPGNLLHFSYSGMSDFISRMDRYSTLAAEEVVRGGKKPSTSWLIFRPLFTFLKMFVLKRGFLDGYHGFLLSVLYGVYTFCKYAKALEVLKEAHRLRVVPPK